MIPAQKTAAFSFIVAVIYTMIDENNENNPQLSLPSTEAIQANLDLLTTMYPDVLFALLQVFYT